MYHDIDTLPKLYTYSTPDCWYLGCLRSFSVKSPLRGSSLPIWCCHKSCSDTYSLRKALHIKYQVYNLDKTQNRCWPEFFHVRKPLITIFPLQTSLRPPLGGILPAPNHCSFRGYLHFTHKILPCLLSSVTYDFPIPIPPACILIVYVEDGGNFPNNPQPPTGISKTHRPLFWQLNSCYCRNCVQLYIQS